MAEKDKQTLTSRFNTAYYLGKPERPYIEFGDMLTSDMYLNERAGANFLDTAVHPFV